jgi:hypothetical protein
MINEYQIDEFQLKENPIILNINVGGGSIPTNILIKIAELNYTMFFVTHQSLSDNVQIDLSELFSDDEFTEPRLRSYTVGITENELNTDYLEFGLRSGGISNAKKRFLKENNENIFSSKLFNRSRNFLLTTRTDEKIIAIPENEIDENIYICSYLMGNDIDIIIGEDLGFELTYKNLHRLPQYMEIGRAMFSVKSLLHQYFDQSNKISNVLRIVNSLAKGDNYAVKIVITEAKPTNIFLDFKNSWKVTERIALYKFAEYMPEIEPAEQYQKWDNYNKIYLKKQRRNKITHIFTAQTDQRPQCEDTAFILDLLASENINFVVGKKKFPCRVELADSAAILESNKRQDRVYKIKITLNDDDQNVSDDFNDIYKSIFEYLAEEDDDIIINENSGNIYFKEIN